MAKIKTVSIAANSDGKYKVDVKAGERTIYVDQSVMAGGTDTGPSPMDYFLTALAGCVATTARIMADQKQIKLKGINMKLEGALDLSMIYGKSKEGRAGFTGVKVTLNIDSDMSREEKEAFVKEMACRCPVSDNIANITPLIIEAM